MANLRLVQPMLDFWQELRVFLLYNKGFTDEATNYMPKSILKVLHKLVPSHLEADLADSCDKNGLHQPRQVGGLINRRNSDHIWHLNALMAQGVASCGDSATPMGNDASDPGNQIYHLHMDFNKAFNSVPREALREALTRYGITG